MKVSDVMNCLDRGRASFIGCPNRMPSIATAASQPDCHRFRIVVTAVRDSAPDSIVGCAAEFAHPNDQGFVQESTISQIANQRCDRPINPRNQRTMCFGQIVVRVPSTRVDLDEPDPLFD